MIDVLPPEPSGPPKVYFKMLGRRSSTLQDESAEEGDCGGGISEAQLFLDVKVGTTMEHRGKGLRGRRGADR